ncbi:MAG: hypothetical protein HON98_00820 [Chloroflexi bacterium]|nr:hypothetical protein [Chloroflexota bacterium]MBT3669671.1 hypothetical protein [Chloroflexota bacterium]MBT4003568.1 hypothetical protein [Chloroflexota bacterium]MBT4305078.1 hypothetical protein [Chloroflexota bacterium]MBT4533401.1 hypothetical protein [Chloroflexota bacterium]
MKKSWIAYPYIFALASLLFLYTVTSDIVSPLQLLRPLVVFWALLVLLHILMKSVGIDKNWSALMLGVFVLGIFSTRLFFVIAGSISIVSCLLWWLILKIRKLSVKVNQIAFILNAISVFLVIVFSFWNYLLLRKVPWGDYRQAVEQSRNDLIAKPTTPENLPDIYYIILDGYGRADILDEIFEYDNSDFIDSLKSRSFIVPEESHSNYPRTVLSVASTLNMDYISTLIPGLEDSIFWWLMSPLIDHSQTRLMLESVGYQMVSVATDWSITDNTSTDFYFKPNPVSLSDFENHLVTTTPLGFLLSPVIRSFSSLPSFDGHRESIDYSFKTLSDIPEMPGAKFTFSHIVTPHPPFVFNENGNSIDPDYKFWFADGISFPGGKEEYRDGYVNQLVYTNTRILEVVDDIIARSKTPPIIIIQADHGPGLSTDFSSSDNTCLKERFSVFAAYYLPGVDAGEVPNDLSGVNIFRLIQNLYFGTDLPLLENKYLYTKDALFIYQAEDVTFRVEEPCEIFE